MGLVMAVDRYEASCGAFRAYAIPTVTGEIVRRFRDALWSVHVPRRVQELRNKVRITRSELQTSPPGEPTIAELAAPCGLDQDEGRDGMDALRSFKSLFLDAETSRTDHGDGMPLTASLGTTEAGFDTVIDHEAVKPALRALPERESEIPYMRFFQDKTQNQIASELGISQMHVFRLLTRSCSRVRRQALAEHQDAA